jgi:tetratricopeptide (TPR) repeat protein
MASRSTLALAAFLLPVLAAVSAGAAEPAPSAPPAPAPQTAPGSFEEASRRAAAGRSGGDVAEAIRWYQEGVRLRPSWDEGWWYLGALSYERGDSTEAARAFARFVELKPDSGPGWALLGLSRFQQKDYDAALRDLTRGLSLGTVGSADVRDVVYYHVTILRIRAGQFELAVEPLTVLARAKPESPALVTACGLVLLRKPHLPDGVPAEDREIVQAVGSATCAGLALLDGAGPRFEELLRKYPKTPTLHYGYGAYLLRKGNASAAIEQFEKEIEVDPEAVYARLEIAFELIRDGQHARALPYAEQAVQIAPGLFAAHNALGRALFEIGQAKRGIAELEEAVRLAPESVQARTALAGAYARAGRSTDAEREREALRKLEEARGPSSRSSLAREQGVPREEEKP